jgi:hypothetical protein
MRAPSPPNLVGCSMSTPPFLLPSATRCGSRSGCPAGDPSDRFLVGLAVLTLLTRTSETRSVLVVVDVAQGLDQISLQTLAFVARRLLAGAVATASFRFEDRLATEHHAMTTAGWNRLHQWLAVTVPRGPVCARAVRPFGADCPSLVRGKTHGVDA